MIKMLQYVAFNGDYKEHNVDCGKHLHECKSECCNNNIYLTHKEVKSGLFKDGIDYNAPYRLKRDKDGFCVYLKKDKCSVHDNKPQHCKGYKCKRF